MKEDLELMDAFFNNVADTYEEMHFQYISGGIETKDMLADLLPTNTKKLVDLGAGTGLELKKIFERFPNVSVIAIDVAEKMLGYLQAKYADKDVTCIVKDYFDVDLKKLKFDTALSVMSLHHFEKEKKLVLYKRIRDALPENGVFINSDYIVPTEAESERELEAARVAIGGASLSEKNYHLDIPMCLDAEINALKEAGFSEVKTVFQVGNNATLLARK